MEEASTRGHNNSSTELEAETFWAPMPVKLQANKHRGGRVNSLARVIDFHYQGEIRLLLHNGGKEDYACNAENYLGVPLSTTMPNSKSSWRTKAIHNRQDDGGLRPFRNESLGHSIRLKKEHLRCWKKAEEIRS